MSPDRNGTIRLGSGAHSSIPWASSSKQPSMASCFSKTATRAGTGGFESANRSWTDSVILGLSPCRDAALSASTPARRARILRFLTVPRNCSTNRSLSGFHLRRKHFGVAPSTSGSSTVSPSGSPSYHSLSCSTRSAASR